MNKERYEQVICQVRNFITFELNELYLFRVHNPCEKFSTSFLLILQYANIGVFASKSPPLMGIYWKCDVTTKNQSRKRHCSMLTPMLSKATSCSNMTRRYMRRKMKSGMLPFTRCWWRSTTGLQKLSKKDARKWSMGRLVISRMEFKCLESLSSIWGPPRHIHWRKRFR